MILDWTAATACSRECPPAEHGGDGVLLRQLAVLMPIPVGCPPNCEPEDDVNWYGVASSRRQLVSALNLASPQALGENLDPTVL
ncbi:hypothetical protein U9M48_043761 [Paspalum notatum var. saurae]|uniref:Uncharacterized protein n=1 Tax=Paspalum notatum var. saurae TaxID=547442 RepID=A0AAQ3UXU4_PASNO